MDTNRNSETETQASGRSRLAATGGPTEGAIRRRMLADAVQHPATLLPTAAAMVAGIYLVLLVPVFGGAPEAIGLAAVAGTVAAASFVWRYVVRHAEQYTTSVREMADLQDTALSRAQQVDTRSLTETLLAGFEDDPSGHGLWTLRSLVREHELLQLAMPRHTDGGPLSVTHVPELVAETYRRGLSVLADALELMNAADASGREAVEQEIARLEEELDAPRPSEEHQGPRREMLAAHRERLKALDQLQAPIDELLFQAQRCEAALHRTRIELAGIRAGSSEASVDSVTEALHSTINQAKEVQHELRRLGL